MQTTGLRNFAKVRAPQITRTDDMECPDMLPEDMRQLFQNTVTRDAPE